MSGLRISGFAKQLECRWGKAKGLLFLLSLLGFVLNGSRSLAETKSSEYAKTRYPIVMVPGALAFDRMFGVLDYWHGITEQLRRQGAEVYVTNLSGAASNVKRGEELLEDIRKIRALTGAKRVNLFAHSQGGLAARYVASVKPEWIESVNCITCMNEGTEFADNLGEFVQSKAPLKVVANIALSAVFSAIEIFSNGQKDGAFNSEYRGKQIANDLVVAAGTKNVDEFNQKFPEGLSKVSCVAQSNGDYYRGISGDAQVNNVSYFSWGGTSTKTNSLDPVDSLLVPIVKAFMPKSRIMDGLVRSCGHPLGVLTEGFYPVNHFDAVNQLFGVIGSGIDIPTLYALNANRLQKEGH